MRQAPDTLRIETAAADTRKLPVVAPVSTAPRGLSEAEAAARRARGEGNAVPFVTGRTYRRILFENAFTFINILLFAIVIFLGVLELYGDALMTMALVTVNVVVGVFQEVRAKRKLDRIALLTRPTATVVRGGTERTQDPNDIVRGDLLVVRPGDQVLVDGSVVESAALSVDESLLTGESDLVQKRAGDAVYSGSFCITGSGHYEAEKVGAASMAQQLTGQARQHRDVKTPLQHEIVLVIRIMVVIAIALGAQVADTFRQIYNDVPLTESVRAAAVIVALVPQGLIFMVTVTYAMAAARMSGRGALIQRMNAVESTSQIDVLCTDKTGTLTTNQLALHDVEPFGIDAETLRRRLGDYAASTTAGNRTTDALRAACGGRERAPAAEAPFSSERKWSALAFGDGDLRGLYVLGAPEMLAPALAEDAPASSRADGWRSRGLRVLLFAHHPDTVISEVDGVPRLPDDLTPLGYVAFSDELRPEASNTIARFREVGIALKVISGDNPETVAALARQAGLDGNVRAVSGLELEGLDDDQLRTVARETTVFGRITPAQKESLVRALRAERHYVAMIGDGVNDVLALKQANLAVAMRSGSQVSRSVSDIVLMEDSFAALPAAFSEGQRILKGMQDIIRLFLVRTLYVSLIILGVTLLNQEFPVTPKQNGLLALLTVGLPALFLAAWARPGPTPRRLVPSAAHFVLPAALSITFVGLVIYQVFLTFTGDIETARTALTVTTVLCGLALIPFSEPPTEAWTGGDELSGDWRPTILAGALLAAFLATLLVEPAREFYELTTLPLSAYLLIGIVVAGWASLLRSTWRMRLVERGWARVAAITTQVRNWRRRRREALELSPDPELRRD
jgi:cation-transporting ATPase E